MVPLKTKSSRNRQESPSVPVRDRDFLHLLSKLSSGQKNEYARALSVHPWRLAHSVHQSRKHELKCCCDQVRKMRSTGCKLQHYYMLSLCPMRGRWSYNKSKRTNGENFTYRKSLSGSSLCDGNDVTATHCNRPGDGLNHSRLLEVVVQEIDDFATEWGFAELPHGSRNPSSFQGHLVCRDPLVDVELQKGKNVHPKSRDQKFQIFSEH